jgi:hypothetical protein
MGSGCLDLAETRARVTESCCVVFLHRPLDVLHRRISAQLAHAPGSLVEFLAGPPRGPETLESWRRARSAAEASAHAQIECGDRHPSRVAEELLSSLGRLTGTTEARADAAP